MKVTLAKTRSIFRRKKKTQNSVSARSDLSSSCLGLPFKESHSSQDESELRSMNFITLTKFHNLNNESSDEWTGEEISSIEEVEDNKSVSSSKRASVQLARLDLTISSIKSFVEKSRDDFHLNIA